MSTLSPTADLLQLRDTNVSSPSVIHRSTSPQSVTASESYYSLSSGSSSRTAGPNDRSAHSIQRFTTPPSRYRTPLQSRDNLADQGTPLRGQGQRRYSQDEAQAAGLAAIRESTIRRKPVPSTVMEARESSSTNARSSAAIDRERTYSISPGVDNTPFLHFALDQLTRDEDVRGSRIDPKVGKPEEYKPRISTANYNPTPSAPVMTAAAPVMTAATPASGAGHPVQSMPEIREPPPRNPNRPISSSNVMEDPRQIRQPVQPGQPDVFLPLAASTARPLRFRPAILRPVSLILFLLLTLVYLAFLLLAAIYSLRYTGLWTYGTIGDNRYFVFQYLPILLGMLLLLWLFQIQVAVARIAPFLSMSSNTPQLRVVGKHLPIYLGDFILPKFRYFRAGLPVIAIFMLIAWMQLFTIPLLASSFNVYFVGSNWRWTAVQGTVWATVGLYILLALATITLMIYLARLEETGLRWDPRSIADLVVMLERSNALDAEPRNDPARLGYWRTANRPNDAFHTYGHVNIEPRRYGVDGGRIKEKPIRESAETDAETNRWRHSKDAMLGEEGRSRPGIAFPWFLHITFSMLWVTIAVVLLLAFLIVSYLPSTLIFNGFTPSLGVIVGPLGFGADNFLFSFISAVLAMLALLFWTNIDFAFRRYQPVLSLLHNNGSLAERSLLLSYPADFPGIVSLAAAANGHWRVAWVSFNTLIAVTLPILGGGCFWAQFDVTTQAVRIYAHQPAFYALTVFVTIYALSYFLILPFTHAERELAIHTSHDDNHFSSFSDVLQLVRNSKILDDFAFHSPISKVDLVTRLLSVQPGARVESNPEAGASMLSLADSVRGFGNARQRAIGGTSSSGVPRYGLGRWAGRDGNDFNGIFRY